MINQSMLSSSNDLAAAYQKSGKTYDACFVQDEAIKMRNVCQWINTCIMANTTNLWFGFE
jgi:hypothetical protein